ncbi:MAG: hypothetical protein DRO12_01725 [Thermoprotei archaeon]|nr:MAG: hypothetical protein DRO12_01725 [Thermoprotei archaeon]
MKIVISHSIKTFLEHYTYLMGKAVKQLICRTPIVLGKIGNRASPLLAEVVSPRPIPVGTYATVETSYEDPYSGDAKKLCLVGVISSTSFRRSVPVSGIALITSGELHEEFEGELGKYSQSYLRFFAAITHDMKVTIPRIPPPPDASVYLAPTEVLSTLFSSRNPSSIPVGHLLGRPDVRVFVDVNALAKHLFITGTTGSGKSNTIAILVDRIAAMGGLAIVYDVHGEYSGLLAQEADVREVELAINPLKIPPHVLAKMVVPEGTATVQRRLVSRALRQCRDTFAKVIEHYGLTEEGVKKLQDVFRRSTRLHQEFVEPVEEADLDETAVKLFVECLVNAINSVKSGVSDKSIESAITKVEEFFEHARISFVQPSVTELARPGTILVLNASSLDDEQRDYMLKVIADEFLWSGKSSSVRGSPMPLLFVVEEAHLFLSANRPSVSRPSIERLAREGRKFGICLALVSQRPRNIDLNTISQVQNFVVMKLVQESDQRAVMNASDLLTEDLVTSLATLATGEALLIGEWIGRFPALVKIDKHPGKRSGTTPDIVAIWREFLSRKARERTDLEMHKEVLHELKEILGDEP